MLEQVLFPFIVRLCLVALFPFSALHKLLFWREALEQARSSFMPGWTAPPMLVAAMALEVAAPAMILAGWHDRAAALALALYCVVSALMYHRFWRCPDFWTPGHSRGRTEFWDFLKNFGLVGGLLLLAFGTQQMPMAALVRHPGASTAVYTPQGIGAPATSEESHE